MHISLIAPLILMLGSIGVLIGTLALARRLQRRADRRSPLTEGLLRPPGHALSEQIRDLQWDVAAYFAISMALPLMLYALYLQRQLGGATGGGTTALILVVVGVGCFLFVAWKLFAAIKKSRNLHLGWEAELAAAEEINRLMRLGYWTFHDVPGGQDFNLDHVIVGPAGVFVVETKGRPKDARGTGKAGSTVRFNGADLEFPRWRESKPLAQAKANAEWLGRWLTKAVGEPVQATPVVLLPGWWVERTGRGGVLVGNAKEVRQMVVAGNGSRALSEKLQKQVAHQLDQRCRNISPKAYAEGERDGGGR